jgi:hypothetical protein
VFSQSSSSTDFVDYISTKNKKRKVKPRLEMKTKTTSSAEIKCGTGEEGISYRRYRVDDESRGIN